MAKLQRKQNAGKDKVRYNHRVSHHVTGELSWAANVVVKDYLSIYQPLPLSKKEAVSIRTWCGVMMRKT